MYEIQSQLNTKILFGERVKISGLADFLKAVQFALRQGYSTGGGRYQISWDNDYQVGMIWAEATGNRERVLTFIRRKVMVQRGIIKKNLQGIKAHELSSILTDLTDTGLIEAIKQPSTGGRPAVNYRYIG